MDTMMKQHVNARNSKKFKHLPTAFAVIAVYMLCAAAHAFAYVSIAPMAIFLNDAKRTGEIIIRNNAAQQVEISIDFSFGYPVSDSAGHVGLKLINDPSSSEPCAAEWIHAYPRKFILFPGQSRTVRFLLRPPAGLAPGEYWARPIVTSRLHEAMAAAMQQASSMTARVTTAIQTVLALSYRHGDVKTGALLTNVKIEKERQKLVVMPSAVREGNAAYIGYATVRLYDDRNKLVKETTREVAIYYSLRIRLEFDIHDLPKGTYRAEVEFNTNRPGAKGDIIKAPTETKDISLSLV